MPATLSAGSKAREGCRNRAQVVTTAALSASVRSPARLEDLKLAKGRHGHAIACGHCHGDRIASAFAMVLPSELKLFRLVLLLMTGRRASVQLQIHPGSHRHYGESSAFRPQPLNVTLDAPVALSCDPTHPDHRLERPNASESVLGLFCYVCIDTCMGAPRAQNKTGYHIDIANSGMIRMRTRSLVCRR